MLCRCDSRTRVRFPPPPCESKGGTLASPFDLPLHLGRALTRPIRERRGNGTAMTFVDSLRRVPDAVPGTSFSNGCGVARRRPSAYILVMDESRKDSARRWLELVQAVANVAVVALF